MSEIIGAYPVEVFDIDSSLGRSFAIENRTGRDLSMLEATEGAFNEKGKDADVCIAITERREPCAEEIYEALQAGVAQSREEVPIWPQSHRDAMNIFLGQALHLNKIVGSFEEGTNCESSVGECVMHAMVMGMRWLEAMYARAKQIPSESAKAVAKKGGTDPGGPVMSGEDRRNLTERLDEWFESHGYSMPENTALNMAYSLSQVPGYKPPENDDEITELASGLLWGMYHAGGAEVLGKPKCVHCGDEFEFRNTQAESLLPILDMRCITCLSIKLDFMRCDAQEGKWEFGKEKP